MVESRQLLDWFQEHLSFYIQNLTEFVAIPSVAVPSSDGFPYGKGCHDAISWIESKMKETGLVVHDWQGTVAVGILKGKESTSALGIICHSDVVPPGIPWERDPFSLWQKGDWLVGRGATDNKGATLACLYALRFLKEQGIVLKHDVALVVGSAEEIGMMDMQGYLKSLQAVVPVFSLVPDAGFPAVYGEKGRVQCTLRAGLSDTVLLGFEGGTGSSVAPSATAVVQINKKDCPFSPSISVSAEGETSTFVSQGRARHAAMPDGGVDAIGNLARYLAPLLSGHDGSVLSDLGKLMDGFHGEGLGLTLADKESGKLSSVVTKVWMEKNELCCILNIRFPVTFDEEYVVKTLREQMEKYSFSIDNLESSASHMVSLSPIIEQLAAIANKVHGTSDKPYTMSGGTYARLFPNAIAYGMGTPSINNPPPFPEGEGRAHQGNESVYLPRMKKGMAIYVQALCYLDEAID